MTLTGAQILELLKEQWCGQRTAQVLQLSSSVSYTWSAAAAAAITGRPCARRAEPRVRSAARTAAPVEPRAAGYRVTVNSSMAAVGGRFGRC